MLSMTKSKDSGNRWRLRWYPRAALFALLIGIVIAVLCGEGDTTLTGRLGGDFPAFYSAGRIAAEGDWDHLYDFNCQRQMQQNFLSMASTGSFLPFAYPPFVALAYYPIGLFNYRLSFFVHTLLMIGMIALTVRIIVNENPWFKEYFVFGLGIAVLYYPMLRAVLGGQNTPITFLLLVLAWKAGISRREWLAGLFLGLMLFKPQFGLPLIGLHLLAWRLRTVASSLIVATALYGIGVYLQGPWWIMDWLAFSARFANMDSSINQANSVSWVGFLQGLMGTGSTSALVLGWILSGLTAMGVSWVWIAGPRGDLSVRFAVSTFGLILIQPHAMYYDMALILFAYTVCFWRDNSKSGLLCVAWLLGFAQAAASRIGFSPLFLVLISTGAIVIPTVLRTVPSRPSPCRFTRP